MSELVDRLIRRFNSLESSATANAIIMQEIAEYLQPERASFMGRKANSSQEREKIFDSTPEDALGILASDLHSLLTPSVHAWLYMALAGDNEELETEEKEWVDSATKAMVDEFNNEEGGFHSAVAEFYLDLPCFGTAGFFVDEIEEYARYLSIPLSEIRFSENAKGLIDTVFRSFEMSARQILERWPKHQSDSVNKAMEKTPDKKFKIIHVIEPRKKFKKDAIKAKDMEIASYYIELTSKSLLSESGYQEMPMMVSRWSKVSGEVHGRGIGQKALPDIRVLNAMNRSLLIAGEKQADPPTLLPHDGFIGEFSSDGGALNYYRGSTSMQDRVITLDSKANLSALDAIIERRQTAIRKMFLNDKLQVIGNPQMTATEVNAVEKKNMRIMAPVMSRQHGEFLAPLVKRQFGIMLRNERIPEIPESLRGRELRMQYISPISRAQKQTEAEGFTQAMTYLGPIVQVAPQISKNFDFDKVARGTPDLFGYPAKYLKDLQTMKKEAEAEAQAQQEQKQMLDAQNALTLAGQAKGLQDNGQQQ